MKNPQDKTGRSESTMKILDYLSPNMPKRKATRGGQLDQENLLDDDFLSAMRDTEEEGPPAPEEPPPEGYDEGVNPSVPMGVKPRKKMPIGGLV